MNTVQIGNNALPSQIEADVVRKINGSGWNSANESYAQRVQWFYRLFFSHASVQCPIVAITVPHQYEKYHKSFPSLEQAVKTLSTKYRLRVMIESHMEDLSPSFL